MRALLQRVTAASVSVQEKQIASIERGLLILLGVGKGDSEASVHHLADKIAHLRIFADAAGKVNLSVLDIDGEAIVVSQFTLYADATKGRRPSFTDAAPPDIARSLVAAFIGQLEAEGVRTQAGAFGQHMLVEIHNDGPVTVWLEH